MRMDCTVDHSTVQCKMNINPTYTYFEQACAILDFRDNKVRDTRTGLY